jgi:hypothetical protein
MEFAAAIELQLSPDCTVYSVPLQVAFGAAADVVAVAVAVGGLVYG